MKTTDLATDFESVKGEQSLLILLNLAVLAGLVFVHASFLALLGPLSGLLIILVAVRFLMLLGALLWLQNLPITASWTIILYRHFEIWLSIGFAFLASYVAGSAGAAQISDSHYSILMVVPIVSAASAFRLPGALAITAVTIALTFLQVWLFFQRHPPSDVTEYFEAATVCLIFLVVSLVVWLLVSSLRREQLILKDNLLELNRTRDRLVAEEKLAAVGRLASAIAHEIRNPVAMISSSLTMAMRQTKDSSVRDEMFEVAAQEAARLEKLTSDFLAYARVKAPARKTVFLHHTLGYVASLGKAMATQANIRINFDISQDLKAAIDDSQIQAALLNLLTNAFEAMPSGGDVTLGALTTIEGDIVIYVENSGEQLTAEVAEHIFEPFFTTKQGGTGLGLSIVHNIARSHGGNASLAVNERGRVRFIITLPPTETNETANSQEQQQCLVFS
jgi:two-component system, NtrC family, sensor histidine kinase HydH